MPTLGIGIDWTNEGRILYIFLLSPCLTATGGGYFWYEEQKISRAKRASEEKLFRNLCLYITTGCFVEKRDLIFLSLFFCDLSTLHEREREKEDGNDRAALLLLTTFFLFHFIVSTVYILMEVKKINCRLEE